MTTGKTLTKIAEILAQLKRGNTWSCDTRWLCSQLKAALTERDKLRADYEGAVYKFDACRGALATVLDICGAKPNEMPEEDSRAWHEWLIDQATTAVDALRKRVAELEVERDKWKRVGPQTSTGPSRDADGAGQESLGTPSILSRMKMVLKFKGKEAREE